MSIDLLSMLECFNMIANDMAQLPFQSVFRVVSAIGLITLLPACSDTGVSRAFGLERSMPDEYTVTTRAPLSMPPSEQLGFPGHGARTNDESPRTQALETLSPNAALQPTVGRYSAGQQALVDQATHASKALGNAELGAAGAGLTDELMFWRGGKAGSIVDGEAENRRIQRASALGTPLSTGATPTRKAKSAFLGVF